MTDETTTHDEQNEVAQELATVTASVASFAQYQEGIAALNEQHPTDLVVPEISTGKGMAAAIAGRAAYRNPRIALDKARAAAKAPVIALGKKIDSLAASIRDQLLIGEQNYDKQIKAEEDRKDAIRAEAQRQEQVRIQGMQSEIATLTSLPVTLIGADADKLREAIAFLEGQTLESFDDVFLPSAQQARDVSLDQLRTMLDAKVVADEQAERNRQEQERLTREEGERKARIAQEDADRAARQKDEDDKRAADALALEHISDIRTMPARLVGKTAAQIEEAAEELLGVTASHPRFGDHQEAAQVALDETHALLTDMQRAAEAQEQQAAANEAERVRLADEASARQAEQEAQEQAAAAERQQREQAEAQERAATAEREREAREEQERQAAEIAERHARIKLVVAMPDGSRWAVPARVIVEDCHRSTEDAERALELFRDADELQDWAANNMNWSDVVEHAEQITPPAATDYQEGWVNGEKEVVGMEAQA